MSMFDKFNEVMSEKERKEMEERINKAGENNVSYVEIPSGTYAVELEKMEVKPTSWGDDQVSIQFNIIEGEFKGKKIFYSGAFYDHFAKGFIPTAKLISGLTGDEVADFVILKKLEGDKDELNDYLLDLFELISDNFTFDLKYTVSESNKINPNNNKPYVNKFYSIEEVYETE